MKANAITLAAFSMTLAGSATAECLRLQDAITLGPFFGGSYTLDSNTNVQLVPSTFWQDTTTPAPGPWNSEMVKNDCLGGSAALSLNNTNLLVNILQREASAQAISLHYCDLGGFENVSAAISAPPQYVGEITQVPTPLVSASGEPVDVDVSESAIPGGKSGELVFKNTEGNLNVMIAGGQEFFAYAICVE